MACRFAGGLLLLDFNNLVTGCGYCLLSYFNITAGVTVLAFCFAVSCAGNINSEVDNPGVAQFGVGLLI